MEDLKYEAVGRYYVEIVDADTKKVVKRMGPHSYGKAQKIESGAGISLDWERFFTRIVVAEGDKG